MSNFEQRLEELKKGIATSDKTQTDERERRKSIAENIQLLSTTRNRLYFLDKMAHLSEKHWPDEAGAVRQVGGVAPQATGAEQDHPNQEAVTFVKERAKRILEEALPEFMSQNLTTYTGTGKTPYGRSNFQKEKFTDAFNDLADDWEALSAFCKEMQIKPKENGLNAPSLVVASTHALIDLVSKDLETLVKAQRSGDTSVEITVPGFKKEAQERHPKGETESESNHLSRGFSR